LASVLVALALAPPEGEHLPIPPPAGWSLEHSAALTRYLRLDNWDSLHFYDLAVNGYRMPEGEATHDDVHAYRANVTFLPSYPLATAAVMRLTGLGGQLALLVTSQLFCVLFWTLLLARLRRRGRSPRQALGEVFGLWVFPSAFYLVAGYTESLFLAGLLVLIVCSDRLAEKPSIGSWAGGALSGAVMTGSRLVGLPGAGYPFFLALASSRSRGLSPGRRAALVALSGAAGLGALGFFTYCAVKFGHWDLYFRLLDLGWGQKNLGPSFLLQPSLYLPHYFFEDTYVSLNRTAGPFALGWLLWGAREDWREGRARALALRATGLMLLALAFAGKAAAGMDGMTRYVFPPLVLGLLARAEVPVPALGARRKLARALGFALLFACQAYLLRRFLLGHWVS
jgi:hypothetical protein